MLFAGCAGGRIESALQQAEELKGTRKFEEALGIYKDIIARYPQDERAGLAYLKMGDLYFYTFNNYEGALDAYARIIQRWPLSGPAFEAGLRRAEIYSAEKKPRFAIAEYEWILKHFPESVERFEVRVKLAETYLNLGDPYQASVDLEDVLKDEGASGGVRLKALFDLGESYFSMDQCEKAVQIFKDIEDKYAAKAELPISVWWSKRNPYVSDARLHMFECFIKLDMVEDADRLGRKLLRLYPDSEIIKKAVEGYVRREEKAKRPENAPR